MKLSSCLNVVQHSFESFKKIKQPLISQSNSYLTSQLPPITPDHVVCNQNSSYNLSSPFILYLCHTLKINKPKYYKTMAKELELKYGCNPNQKPSRIFMQEGELPIEVLNGRPGYINFLDAFNSWQLVKELKEATGLPAAASFKHVSPAGAAVGIELNDTLKKIYL